MANQKWEYDKDNMVLVTQSRKLLTKHPEEAAACFNNLNKVVTQLNCGHRLGSFGFNFFRSEGKGVYRIGQTAVSSSFEMRFYICFDEDKKICYFLAVGGKQKQASDIVACQKAAEKLF